MVRVGEFQNCGSIKLHKTGISDLELSLPYKVKEIAV